MVVIQKNPGVQINTGEQQSASGYVHRQKWTAVATASTTAQSSGLATSNSVTTTVTTFTAQPDFPRNLVITPGGTTASVPAGNVVVTGTNIRGDVITENFTFTSAQSSATTGSKAFKTVTSVVFPIQGGSGATYSIGTGVKLGLDRKLAEASVVDAYADGVREATAATVAFSSSAVESNTVSTSTAPNGTRNFSVYVLTTDITANPATTA